MAAALLAVGLQPCVPSRTGAARVNLQRKIHANVELVFILGHAIWSGGLELLVRHPRERVFAIAPAPGFEADVCAPTQRSVSLRLCTRAVQHRVLEPALKHSRVVGRRNGVAISGPAGNCQRRT